MTDENPTETKRLPPAVRYRLKRVKHFIDEAVRTESLHIIELYKTRDIIKQLCEDYYDLD